MAGSAISEEQIEKEYHVSWYIIAYKLVFGIIEFLLGVGISFFGRAALIWYKAYIAQELFEDPGDLLVRLTEGIIPNVLAHHTFLAIYLIILGAAKIAGSIGLILKQNWGVDLLIGLTIVMLPFQIVEMVIHRSYADFVYVFVGLVIALYLVNFRPNKWIARMTTKVKNRRIK